MNANGFGEGLTDTVLWSAGSDQLEPLQVINLSPTLERIQETLEIHLLRCGVPQTTTLIQHIYQNHWKLLTRNGVN